MTKEQQAIKIIKQLIDQAIEAGVLKNIETANLVYQSFQILNIFVIIFTIIKKLF